MVNSEKNDAWNSYIDQESGCLHNLLGIKDQKELSSAEAALVLIRCYELECAFIDQPVNKAFDFEHLKGIHKHLFQDVYEWAGQVRRANIGKGNTCFLPYQGIEEEANSLFSKLKQHDYLKGMSPDEFSKNAGHYMGEINYIHPFREGNGRTQREFINQLAQHSGYYIEWKNVSKGKMILASIEAERRNTRPLAELIHENLVDRDIVLFIKQNRSYDGRYSELCSAKAGNKYDGTIIGVTERHVMQASINSPSQVTIHNRHSLSRTPDMNKRVEISYPHGDIGLVREPEILKEKGSSKTHNLEKNSHQHEEHGRER